MYTHIYIIIWPNEQPYIKHKISNYVILFIYFFPSITHYVCWLDVHQEDKGNIAGVVGNQINTAIANNSIALHCFMLQ